MMINLESLDKYLNTLLGATHQGKDEENLQYFFDSCSLTPADFKEFQIYAVCATIRNLEKEPNLQNEIATFRSSAREMDDFIKVLSLAEIKDEKVQKSYTEQFNGKFNILILQNPILILLRFLEHKGKVNLDTPDIRQLLYQYSIVAHIIGVVQLKGYCDVFNCENLAISDLAKRQNGTAIQGGDSEEYLNMQRYSKMQTAIYNSFQDTPYDNIVAISKQISLNIIAKDLPLNKFTIAYCIHVLYRTLAFLAALIDQKKTAEFWGKQDKEICDNQKAKDAYKLLCSEQSLLSEMNTDIINHYKSLDNSDDQHINRFVDYVLHQQIQSQHCTQKIPNSTRE